MLGATLFLQKFPETRNRNRYLFSGKISETRAQGKYSHFTPLLLLYTVVLYIYAASTNVTML